MLSVGNKIFKIIILLFATLLDLVVAYSLVIFNNVLSYIMLIVTIFFWVVLVVKTFQKQTLEEYYDKVRPNYVHVVAQIIIIGVAVGVYMTNDTLDNALMLQVSTLYTQMTLIVYLCPFAIVLLHELQHLIFATIKGSRCLMFTMLGVAVTSSGVTLVNFDLLGGLLLDCSHIDNEQKEHKFIKWQRIEVAVIYTTHLLQLIAVIVLQILFNNILTLTALIIVGVFSLAIIAYVFDKDGDVRKAINCDKAPDRYVQMSGGECFVAYKNKYLFDKVEQCLCTFNDITNEHFVLYDYYLDYCLYHANPINELIVQKFNAYEIYDLAEENAKIALWQYVYGDSNAKNFDNLYVDKIHKGKTTKQLVLCELQKFFPKQKYIKQYVEHIKNLINKKDNQLATIAE